MVSIVLGQVGTAIGGAIAGPVGAALGYSIGSFVGGYVNNQIYANNKTYNSIGPRIADLAVQTSTYGKMIPILYGTARIAGNIIWSLPIKETAITHINDVGGKGGVSRRARYSHTSYSYSITIAIALCEGPIDSISRVWADTKILDPSKGIYRVHLVTEEQMPDPIIEAHEGKNSTPAYRGLAYVVIEDFPLADYGNRIPNFTFEVKKRITLEKEGHNLQLEEMIKSIVMIPGSGEFVYDTMIQNKVYGESINGKWIPKGKQTKINQNNRYNKADAIVSLDQLKANCKNIEWIAPVVTWFGDSLDVGKCKILPGVEYREGLTIPEIWKVGKYERETAYLITHNEMDAPVYGGTISDNSIIRYLNLLKEKNYKVMFYPMIFMDTPGKPWRGRLTGDFEDIIKFFIKPDGYNEFILYYANLVKNQIDAFVIGSELIGLTKIKDKNNNFPAVNALINLAAKVKAIVGNKVKVTYAADWSEYHHTEGGWYNLDPLWASPNIDMIGINAYFPLTESLQTDYDEKKVIEGWTKGEGYDFYYVDEKRTIKSPISAPYAWKNIEWWWSNVHTNPDATITPWRPYSKKIWFTEYGFPSIDCSTNQPNVFYDPNSKEGDIPYFSKGRIDIQAQRVGLYQVAI